MIENAMTKHDVLTEQEMANFVFNPRILKQLERCRKKLNLEKDQMNILDWGCGRGRAVVWLREQGYKTFGVDIDPEPVENCRNLLSSRGVNPDSLIYLIQNNTAKEFPDKHFHFIFSYGVFEHIKDLVQVAAEFKRIMAPEAIGAHFFPALAAEKQSSNDLHQKYIDAWQRPKVERTSRHDQRAAGSGLLQLYCK